MLTGLLAAILAFGALARDDPERELAELREKIAELQQNIRRDTDRRDSLSGQLRDAEQGVQGARGRLDDVQGRLAESEARLKSLAAERARNEAALAKQRDVLAAELRSAYVGGRQEQFKLLLSQEDPATLARMLAYYSYFGRARSAKIAEIQGIVARLDEDAKTEAAEREAAALEKLIADLRRAMSDLPPTSGQAFEKVRGRLTWPVAGELTARYGQSRGGGLKWNGVMIEAPRGTAVKALYEGRVAYADWLPGMGLLLIVDHGGYMSLYAHNEQLYKAVGERVTAGEAVGTVGDTGGRSQPGLYLEIRRGAKPIDPVPWFRRPTP